MLESIEIRNFKAIKDEPLPNVGAGFIPPDEKYERDGIWYKKKPLILKDLTNVNYLVGENGSGKSSVLEGLYIFQDTNYIKDKYAHDNCYIAISKNKEIREFKDGIVVSNEVVNFGPISFSNDPNSPLHFSRRQENEFKKYGSGSLEKFSNIQEEQDLKDLNDTLSILGITQIIAKSHSNPFTQGIIFTQNGSKIDIKSLSSGVRLVHSFRISIIKVLKNLNLERLNNIIDQRFPLFIIEEPETFLHPHFQKLFPKILKSALLEHQALELQAQFLISTHSPFIISEAGKIAEEEIAKGEKPSQKVYLIEGGQCKESKGFIGSKVKNQVAKMLGAGLGDLSNVEPKTNINSPIIVLCEGKTDNNSVEDSVFYNEIFRDKFPSVLFISCEGQGSITSNFYNFSNFKDNVSGNFNLYSLKDRDLKFTDQELKDEIIKHPNIKYTKNRFIECYIYNEITAKLYAKLKSLKLVDNKLSELQNFTAKIQIKASNKDKNGQSSKQIKNKLKNLFKETLNESEISFDSNFMKEIGELIRFNKEGDSNKIYNELYNCIFGSSIKDELEKAEFNQERLRSIAKSFGVKPEKQADDDMIKFDR